MKATVLVSAAEIEAGEVRVDGERYRHLFRARRASRDSEFRLTDGGGRVCEATLAEVDSTSARLVAAGPPIESERPPWVGLIVPVLKRQRTSWMVEKATELGVSEIWFYSGPRAPRAFAGGTQARLERVTQAALVQSHGAWLPCLHAPRPLAEVVTEVPESAARYVAARQASRRGRLTVPAAWAIGAEGGWSDEETGLLRTQGFTPVPLADGVLRTETAALAAVAVTRGD